MGSIEMQSGERLTAEMEVSFETPSAEESRPIIVRIRKGLPDFLQSIKLKYVRLGYHYMMSHAMYLLTLILFVSFAPLLMAPTMTRVVLGAWDQLRLAFTATESITTAAAGALLVGLYFMRRKPKSVYLVNFACYLPEDELKITAPNFVDMTESVGCFEDETLAFQRRITTRSGLGDETYLPRGIQSRPPRLNMQEARNEAEAVMFGALDQLFKATGVRPQDVGILIVNCSLFNPTPSLSAMIVNRYKMRTSIKSYNLGGMGCSAGLISINLARDLLRANPNSLAVVVSTENITLNWYFGNDRSMLLCNCIFRMGGAAMLLSNRPRDKRRSKYELVHSVRTHKGSDDKSFGCVYQREDEQGAVGVSLARELMAVAGDALKTNITTLGPLVLPLTEQLRFLGTLVARKVLQMKVKPYIPNFKLAFEHFCIHAGGRAVLEEIQKNLQLTDWHMEPSRMTLHRFGNTSSSSLWYELAYTEAKGRVSKGDRVWQIAFGSGFKCNSAVWRALRNIGPPTEQSIPPTNPWAKSIDKYPVTISDKLSF